MMSPATAPSMVRPLPPELPPPLRDDLDHFEIGVVVGVVALALAVTVSASVVLGREQAEVGDEPGGPALVEAPEGAVDAVAHARGEGGDVVARGAVDADDRPRPGVDVGGLHHLAH